MKKDEKTNEKFSPYVGLIQFSEKDADYFFGRDAVSEIVATNLRATALTVFYGASGVGKSSLLNARVIPYLKKIAISSNLPDEPPEFILVVLREWANNPLESLRLRLKQAVEETVKKVKIPKLCTLPLTTPLDSSVVEAVKKLEIPKPAQQTPKSQMAQTAAFEYFDEKDVEQMANALKNNNDICYLLKNWADLTGTIFLIIFDQFEDIFLHPEFLGGENSFGDEFAKTLNCKDLPANFVISMRDDALAKMDIFKGKVPNMMKNILRLYHLDRAATEIAIRKPLEKYNEEFGTNFTIEDELVETLLNDLQVDKIKFETQGQAAVNQIDCAPEKVGEDNNYRVETPYLQLVMKRLWENPLTQETQKLMLSTLIGTEPNQLGGVQNIVETHLDKVMEQFTEDEKQLATKFIHFTVTRGGTKIPSDVNDLADWAELTENKKTNVENIRNILDKLCEGENRIFNRVNNRKDSKNPYYEVSHDALGPAIISWRKRQNEILQKMESDFKMKAELEKAAREKEEQERKLLDEQNLREMQETTFELERKNRRLWIWASIGGVAIFLLLSVAAIYFYDQYKQAKKQKQEEKIQQNSKRITNTFDDDLARYKTLIDILIDLQSNDPATINKARETLRTKVENDELPEDYIQKLNDGSGNKNTENGQKEIKIVKNPKIENQPQKTSNNAIIFIQFPNEDTRKIANQWRNFLKASGYFAPNVENVGENAPLQNELRYFRNSDKEQGEKIVKFLSDSQNLTVVLKLISGYEDSVLIKENQFELWFNTEIKSPLTAK